VGNTVLNAAAAADEWLAYMNVLYDDDVCMMMMMMFSFSFSFCFCFHG